MVWNTLSFDPDSVASTSDVASSAMDLAASASDAASSATDKAAAASAAAATAAGKASDASSAVAARSAIWDKASAASSAVIVAAAAASDAGSKASLALGTFRKLGYDAQTGTFTVGNIITGATSGATAVIFEDTGTFLYLTNIVGTFQDDEIIYESALGGELVLNGGFETAGAGGADVFENWGEVASDGSIVDEGSLVHAGSHACKLTQGASIGTQIASDVITTVVGNYYKLSFWTRGDGTNQGIFVVTGAGISQQWTGVPGADYTEVVACGVADGISSYIYFKPGIVNGHIAYYDDASFKQITNAALANGTVTYDDWGAWLDITNTEVARFLSEDEGDEHANEVSISIQVKAVDTFGNESSESEISAVTLGLNILPTDIDEFSITASKIFTKIPILDGDSWTDDSDNGTPSSAEGYVWWNTHTIYYNGIAYVIETGNTDLRYIFWVNGSTAYSSSNTNPTLTDGDFIIAVNNNGAHDLAWNAIANQVIGSAYIQNLAVLNEHVSNLAADKINTGTLEGINIIGNTIKTAASGKAVIITSDGIALYVPTTTGKWDTFKWGDGTKYGTGYLAFIHHSSGLIPFYIQSEQIVADFHFFNRSADPTGVATIGDFAFAEGKPKFCTAAATPGTWKSVLEIEQQAHEADAVTSHSIADASETVDRSDIEDKLDALGTKINAILAKLETTKLFADT